MTHTLPGGLVKEIAEVAVNSRQPTPALAHGDPAGESESTRMQDIKSQRILWFKGGLFLMIGVVSSGVLFVDSPTLRTVGLLSLAIWGFCRAYYFAFYVIEHYVDAEFRFSGLMSFVAYALRKRSDR